MMTQKKLYFKPSIETIAMKKKLLLVVTKSNFGGAQRYIFDIATHLKKESFTIAVAFGSGKEDTAGELSHKLIDAGIQTVHVPELGRDIHLFSDWRAFKALVGLFKAEKPDIVHLNSSKAGGLGALAARLAGVPRIVFTVHGLASDEKRSPLSRLLIRGATWVTLMLAHHTIAVSSDTYRKLRALPFVSDKVSLIYNGIGAIAFETRQEARKILRAIDPHLPEGLLIGTIAELHPNKDLVTAIDAIAAMDNAHLAIIGSGELKDTLTVHAAARGIRERVHFLGSVQNAARYLSVFDIFLLTSLKEGLPYVLLEAGAAHVPIVAVDIPGVRDIIENEDTGLLTPRSPEAIAAALTRLQSNPRLSQAYAQKLAERVRSVFSLTEMLEKTIARY